MPIYEYFCTNCEKKFEKIRPASQCNEGIECPVCHQQAEKVLSKFLAYSSYGPGLTNNLGGGDSCSGCTSTNCGSCNN